MEIDKRLKVLICAYACSPEKGSEPGVGWGFVTALAKYHDLWVLVEEEKFKLEIERYLAKDPELGKKVQFIYLHKKRNRLLRKLWPPSYYWYYRRWHKDAYNVAKVLHSEVDFDLAHQLTMVGFREPGYLWQLGLPFVWGPVGGMGLFPWRFLPTVGPYGACYYAGYNLFNLLQLLFMRRPKHAAIAAGNGLFLATPENVQGASKYWSANGIVIPEVGLPAEPLSAVNCRRDDEPLRIIWTGQHLPGKALNLALESLAQLPESVNWEFHILGEGKRTGKWLRLAKKLEILDCCHFHGWLARDKALSVMQGGHLMLITSLRDLTSTVTVEALALGLPIVCLDHCGFAEVVDESCGLKIPVTSPRRVISDLAEALEYLGRNESKRRLLAEGALKRAGKFTWEDKARKVDELYRLRLEEVSSEHNAG